MSMSTERRVQTRRTTEPGDQPGDDKWQILADTGPIHPVSSSSAATQAVIIASSTKVYPGQSVSLDGSTSTGDSITYKWFQPHGTTVALAPTMAAPIVSFIAPDNRSGGKSIEHTLMFTLHVKDAQGHDSVQSVDITVTVSPSESMPQQPQPQPPLPPNTIQPPQVSPPNNPQPSPTTTRPSKFTADVINHSSKISDQELKKVLDAVKKQMDNEVSQYWGYTAAFNAGPPVAGNVKLGIFDSAQDPGSLGWHSSFQGIPTIECYYVGTYNDLCQTISHEMLETIGDYDASTTIKGRDEQGHECLYYLENCDPVEEHSYFVDGISVSNFVTPAWFMMQPVGGTTDVRTDYMQVTAAPFDIANGGYMEVSYDDGKSWTENRDRVKFDELSGSRKQKRAKRRAERMEMRA